MEKVRISGGEMKNGAGIIVLLARFLVGGILIYASLGKIIDPGGFAKAIANGSAPIAAMISSKEIVEKGYGEANLQSTFGFNPVSCAIANKTLEIHQRDKVWENSEETGKYLRKYLKEKLEKNPYIGDIRGLGMEIGIDFVKDKATKEKNTELVGKVVDKAFENGLH